MIKKIRELFNVYFSYEIVGSYFEYDEDGYKRLVYIRKWKLRRRSRKR